MYVWWLPRAWQSSIPLLLPWNDAFQRHSTEVRDKESTVASFLYRGKDANQCTKTGCGGLEVACWPLVPKIAGSIPTEAVGFLRVNKKNLSTSGGMDVCLLWLLCVVRSLRRTDHSFRGVLPTVVRRCVWSRNLVKMRSHPQSVVIELNRRRITGSVSYKPLISDISVLIVCNKTGGTIKGDIKKNSSVPPPGC